MREEVEQLFVYKQRLVQCNSKGELYVVYPSLSRKIIKKLETLVPIDDSRDKRFNQVVQGYLFEWNFIHDTVKKQILYVHYFYNDHCTFKSFKAHQYLELSIHVPWRMAPAIGTLYLLRHKHSIDAIRYLECNEDREMYLLLIQISLSPYKSHRTKSGHLHNTITVPKCLKSKGCSIYNYYKRLCPSIEDKNIVYVYSHTCLIPIQLGHSPTASY